MLRASKVLQYVVCCVYKYEYGRHRYCRLHSNRPLLTLFCSRCSGALLTSLPFLCPIESLVGLLPNTPGLFIWETHCDTEYPVHDVPGAVACGLYGLNNAAVTVPPSLLQAQLVVGDGSFRMVWWASLSSCVLKNHFFSPSYRVAHACVLAG